MQGLVLDFNNRISNLEIATFYKGELPEEANTSVDDNVNNSSSADQHQGHHSLLASGDATRPADQKVKAIKTKTEPADKGIDSMHGRPLTAKDLQAVHKRKSEQSSKENSSRKKKKMSLKQSENFDWCQCWTEKCTLYMCM